MDVATLQDQMLLSYYSQYYQDPDILCNNCILPGGANWLQFESWTYYLRNSTNPKYLFT